MIFYEVRKRRVPLSLRKLVDELYLPDSEIDKSILSALPEDTTAINSKDDIIFVLNSTKENLSAAVLESINNFNKKNPLLATGRSFEELIGIVKTDSNSISEPVMISIINELTAQRKIKKVENTWSLYNHHVQLDEKEKSQINFIEEYFQKSNMQTPLLSELIKASHRAGIDERKLKKILEMLTAQHKLYRVDENYIHFSIVDKCRLILLEHLNSNKDGITVAGFRDLIKGNRKICLLLLGIFDSEEIISREGDVRKITQSGKKFLLKNE